MKKFWSIPVIAALVYSATILTQYGYNAYFGIPYNFVNASIRDNVIFFHNVLHDLLGMIGLASIWFWIIVIVIFVSVIILCRIFSSDLPLMVLLYIFTAFALVFVFDAPRLGGLMAKDREYFFILSSKCSIDTDSDIYIIPSFYDSTAILVPIDKQTRKIKNSFLIKESSEICGFELSKIGKVLK